jgi:hypothetical protein
MTACWSDALVAAWVSEPGTRLRVLVSLVIPAMRLPRPAVAWRWSSGCPVDMGGRNVQGLS